jgi:acyl-CoA synthetase (AMP-forming)/AMP-acid ligase II
MRDRGVGLPFFLASAHGSYTCEQVVQIVREAANSLNEAVEPGSHVVVHCRDGVTDPLAILAVFVGGCTPLVLRKELPMAVLTRIAADADAQLAPVQEWVRCAIESVENGAQNGRFDDAMSWHLLCKAVSRGQMMSTTSGSSGPPKLVAHSMQRAAANAAAHAKSVGMGWRPLIMTSLPFAFSFQCLTLFLSALYKKGSLYFGSHQEPDEFADAIRRLRPDFVNFTPFYMRSFVRNEGLIALDTVGSITVGGARVELKDLATLEQLVERGRKCYITYGITECGPRISTAEVVPGADHRAGVAGWPLDGVRLRVCPSSGKIEVNTPYLGMGFWNSETRELKPIPAREGWFSSSDLGWFNSEGSLHVEGRADRLIMRHDTKIVPEVIESAALMMPGIAAAMVRSECIEGVSHLVCYAQRAPSTRISTSALLSHLQQNLPASFIPTRVVITDRQLVNQIGKLACLPRIEKESVLA